MERTLPGRQPIHTVYGGAHLFRADTATRLGATARRALEEYAPDAATLATALDLNAAAAERVLPRVRAKLEQEPVEDFRLDFEDGYGTRSDAEEDGHAVSAAREVAAGFKAGTLPPNFVITLPKITEAEQSRTMKFTVMTV